MNLHKAIILTSPLVVAGACVNAANAAFVLHQNSYWSGENLIASQDDTNFVYDAELADDFFLSGPNDIVTGACWYGGFFNGPAVAADWTVTLYDDIAGMPGNVLHVETFPYSSVNEVAHAFDPYGNLHYGYSVTFSSPIQLGAGAYWVSFKGVTGYPPQTGVSVTTTITYTEGHFRSSYFGFPSWTSATLSLGAAYDISFCILGVPAPSSVALLSAAGLLSRRRR